MTTTRTTLIALALATVAGAAILSTQRDAQASGVDREAPAATVVPTETGDTQTVPVQAQPRAASTGMQETSDRELTIPLQHRFQKASYPIRASNWSQYLATLPPAQADYLRELNARYFGALAYDNPQALKEMVALGFPTAEEWLEAQALTDESLKALAKRGNPKAQLFHLDRVMGKATEFSAMRDRDEAAYAKSMGPHFAMQAYELAPQLQASNKSAFAAYMLGHVYSELSFPRSPESAAAGMFLARERGDTRAAALLRQYQARHPQMDLSTVLAAYASMR